MKKVRSAFLFYVQAKMAEVKKMLTAKKNGEQASQADTMRFLSEEWGSLPEDLKAPYRLMQDQDKARNLEERK